MHTQRLWKAACDSSCTLQNSHFLPPPQLFITPCPGMERILLDSAAPNRNPMFWFVTFLVTGKLKKGFLFFVFSHPTSGFSQSLQWPDTREWRDSQQGWQPAPAGCCMSSANSTPARILPINSEINAAILSSFYQAAKYPWPAWFSSLLLTQSHFIPLSHRSDSQRR